MKNRNSNQIFNKLLSKKKDTKWREAVQFQEENKDWLDNSAKIAIKLNRALRDKNMPQKEFAEKLGVSAQQVSKFLKGKENLTFQSVAKFEKVLNIKLLSIISENEIEEKINDAILDYHRKWIKTNKYRVENDIKGEPNAILCVDEEEEYAMAG
jgi:transcriptional regulator with XRE-family HTH domain